MVNFKPNHIDGWSSPDKAGLALRWILDDERPPLKAVGWRRDRSCGLGRWPPSTQDVVTLHEPRVADGLALAASRACEQGAAGHCLQLRHLRMGDVLAVVAADADGIYAVKVAIAISCCIKGENVEKSCIGHCGVPSIFADAALIVAFIV